MVRFLCSVILIAGFSVKAEEGAPDLQGLKQQKEALTAQQLQILGEARELKKTLLNLHREKREKKVNFEKNHRDLSLKFPLIARIGRVDPMQILTDPSISQTTIRSLVILRSMMASLKQQVAQAHIELQDIENLTQEVEGKEKALRDIIKELEKEKVQLIDEEQLAMEFFSREKERLDQEEDINNLLDEAEVVMPYGDKTKKAMPAVQGIPFRWFERPVVGKRLADASLQQKYNPNGKGLIFETKKDAVVLAPASGIVVFNGPFQSQGDILIIDHGEQVYTVLMGMHKISAEVGQSVYAGQKVGMMAGYGKHLPILYLELRQKGKPIDPEPFLID